jgi:glycogen debranching enzyme
MPLEIKVGPPQLAIYQGHTVLVSEPDGQVGGGDERGLYFYDTRVISNWSISANGYDWDLLNSGSLTYYAARIFLINRAFLSEAGDIAARTISLVINRSIDGGMHEDLDLTNYGVTRVRFNLEVAIRSDFADIFEVKSGRIVRRGHITTEWSEQQQQLTTIYRNRDFFRSLQVSSRDNASPVTYANGRITYEIDLAPGQSWHSCLMYELGDGTRRFEPPVVCTDKADGSESKLGQSLADWRARVLKIRTSNEEFYRLFGQAIDDMAALRLPIGGTDHMAFVPAAGLPWFVAVFGRDSLIVSLQNLLVYPAFASGTLEVLASLQATVRDDYRDAEPGKIPHELRVGELAHFKLIPHTPYYGTADATPLYLITLHAAWRASGDHGLLERHLATAERCLEWIDKFGDRDGDGFQEYGTRSPVGYENQAWKDSGDAVMNTDGTPVVGPKALCELQGYVYDAWLRMADVFDALEKPDRAAGLRAKAAGLFTRFNEDFWDEDSGFYAYALDGEKRRVLTVASNPGHCLWSGIVPPDRARRVVARLMAPDMWTGWGIRTLSANHIAYNPFSYQNGSVWPHDNGIIAAGFRRYGFITEAAQIARDISRAAGYFTFHQLPELYAGIQRSETNFPVQYLGANVPQAWAAGTAFVLVQVLLGLQPDAPAGRLYIDPALPDWLPDLTIIDLRLKDEILDIKFWREGQATRYQVLRGDPSIVVPRDISGRVPGP